eukprot:gene11897-13442_t
MAITTKKIIETKSSAKETLLTPRFYTTNFQEISQLDISSNKEEIEAIVEEFRIDYNRDHFIRDKEFSASWDVFDEKTRNIFIEFLERSCTAEFSGFLLYKEISRNLKKENPLLAEGFSFMSRDEARHAGFLNKAMSDFNISLDLGYWRYITIYRHLEKNPNFRVYPLFRFFESWCQDENRHGDFFAALLKSQKSLLNTYESRLWCRFFLLSVFATMYLNDLQRADFYSTIGLDSKQFDQHVIRKTNQSSKTLFPVILDVDHPDFFHFLDNCSAANSQLIEIEKNSENSIVSLFLKIPHYFELAINLVKLYFLPVIETKYIWTEK